MGSGESFDPRTWKGDDTAPAVAPVDAVKPVAEISAAAPVQRWWLGPLLSALVLAGGALAAYETRGNAAAAETAPSAS